MSTSIRSFGVTPSGECVDLITLTNGQISCSILTYGAILNSLLVPGKNGAPVDVVLGFDTLEEYLSDTQHIGAIVGRYANRIAAGRFSLDNKEYTLAVNNGPNHLHGGIRGFSRRIWTVCDLSNVHVTLSLSATDGEEGFPGNLTAFVTYRLENSALRIHYQAQSDKKTPCSLTNHSYFNLNGHASASAMDHKLTLYASHYTPVDSDCLVLGTIDSVEGTPMDFRSPTTIGDRIDDNFEQLRKGSGYDHNYAIDYYDGSLRPAALVSSSDAGISMLVETTQPGIQLYTANFLPACGGKGGAFYCARNSLCLETQAFPDSPNRPNFPSSILLPGEHYSHTTRFYFSCI